MGPANPAAAAIALASTLLMLLGTTVGKVLLGLVQWAGELILGLFGVVPFGGVSFLAGTLVKGQAASAALEVICIPMAYLAGKQVPLAMLPPSLVQLASECPVHDLMKLVHYVVGEVRLDYGSLVLLLVATAVLFFGLARRALSEVS